VAVAVTVTVTDGMVAGGWMLGARFLILDARRGSRQLRLSLVAAADGWR
jgi:hypothetical protein